MRFETGSIPWNKGIKFPQYSGRKHPLFKNLEGIQFGKLTAIKYLHTNEKKESLWLCICECGKKKTVSSYVLRSGKTRSCGCSKGQHISQAKFKHGKTKTPTYYAWNGMIARCYNPKTDSYKYYGERGIKVCKRWRDSFINFLADMGETVKGMSLDRINSKKGYYPKNCRWLPKEENSRRAMMEKYHANN